MILSTFEPAVPLGAAGLGKAPGVPLGLRGSTSMSSGLRSGVALIDAAGQSLEDLHDVRKALAEAEREAARTEARRQFADEVRARTAPTAPESDAGVSAPAERPSAPSDGGSQQAVAAAQIAAIRGEPAGRGSFVNLAV